MTKRKASELDESNKINYVNINKNLDSESLKKYYDKIKLYKLFYPSVLYCGGRCSLEYELGKYEYFDSDDELEKYKMQRSLKLSTFYVGKTPPFEDIKYSHMYYFEHEDDLKLDELDREFTLENKFTKHELFGLFSVPGYHGFFRPSYVEAINLISTKISLDDLEGIERIYLTTEPHPSDKAYECYNNKIDKFKTLTTIYVVKSL
jgi:hypothetical protein